MASVPEPNGREEVSALLRKINEAWRAGRSDELNACFHEDAAICGPDFKVVSRGRQACVKSYEDFVRQAEVREFKASDPAIDLWGSTAVAVCGWQIAYRMNSQDYRESGHDVYVLTREEGRWRVVWRALLPSPTVRARPAERPRPSAGATRFIPIFFLVPSSLCGLIPADARARREGLPLYEAL